MKDSLAYRNKATTSDK